MNKCTPILLLSLALLALTAVAKSQYKVTHAVANSSSIVLDLVYTGQDDYYLKPTSPIAKKLQFSFHVLAFNDFTFKIQDSATHRFEVPQ